MTHVFVRISRSMRLALLALAVLHAAGSLAQTSASSAPVSVLLSRAAQLKALGKPDLAAQAWRQVLLADPQNATALEGLIRFYAQTGDESAARSTLRQLRTTHPQDPALADLQRDIALGPIKPAEQPEFPPTQNAKLLRAEEASRQGDSAEAFHLYRSVFGTNPPREWAIPYFQAEAAIPGSEPAAANSLGQMARQYPDDPSLTIAWAGMLTRDPGTRLQGARILARYAPSDLRADGVLRASLLWGVNSVPMAAEISTYLAQHSDPSLAAAFAQAQSARRKQEETSSAYRALQQKNLPFAQEKFQHALMVHPDDPAALAGMGYVSLQRQNFSAAVHWLALAERRGDHSKAVEHALRTARYWQSVAASRSAMDAHHPAQSETQLHQALDLEPHNPAAILALAHLFAETGRQNEALPLFREIAQRSTPSGTTSPADADHAATIVEAWSGWLTSSAALRDSSTVLLAYRQLSAPLQAQLSASPAFLTSLAQAWLAANQRSLAEQALSHAAQLPSSDLSPQQRTQILSQYAALCMQDQNYGHAQQAYSEIARISPNDPVHAASAWQALVLIEHLQGQDASGLRLWDQMPPALRQRSTQDPPFLLLVAAMQESQKNFAAAVSLYQGVLAKDPNSIPAWTELLRTLHLSARDREARDAEKKMPPAVHAELREDAAYLQTYTASFYQTMASVEHALGNPQAALRSLQDMSAIAHAHNTEMPLDMLLQEAWLEYDLQQDGAAQATLQRLQQPAGAERAETPSQQNQIALLIANLAVQKATRITTRGSRPQAIQVLDQASSRVGNRTTARLRLATGYLTAGAPATALAIYQSAGFEHATVGDRKAAISAAMESKQPALAQAWLQQCLADSPRDAGLLLLAASFAESNGNESLAARYLHAALASSSIPDPPSREPGVDAAVRQTAAQSTRASQPDNDDIHHQAAELLAGLESSHSGWFGGTGYVSHIVGTSGTTQLTDLEIPVEASFPVGQRARFTTVVRTASVNSGSFQASPGHSLGTLMPQTPAASAADIGVAGSLQLATRTLAASIGFTPDGFPVVNLTAAANLHNPHSPWTLAFTRDSIRESQLSYAGLHDPAHPARVWGGVIANLGVVQYTRGNAQSGAYVNASGGVVTGDHVASNPQITDDAGAYRQIWSRGSSPATRSLKLGINFYAQHNDHNELFFTYGHGGYFSPQYYLLPAVPLTYAAQPGKRLRYELSGNLGPQILSQSSASYFPLDPALQASRGNPIYPAQFSIGLNYGAQGKISYLKGQHWRLTAFFSANNAASYNQQIGGFSVRYLFRDQHLATRHAAGWFPYSGLRPYQVP
jgi:tetratricopeptide (TPR) repeat protein